MSSPWQRREGPTNSPQQRGPLTPGRPPEGPGRLQRHRQVWEKRLVGWLGSSRAWGPGCPCPVPVPSSPTPAHLRRGGIWTDVTRNPRGSGSPSMGFLKSGAQATGNPRSGALGPWVHRTNGPQSGSPSIKKWGTWGPCPSSPTPRHVRIPGSCGAGLGRVTGTEPRGQLPDEGSSVPC